MKITDVKCMIVRGTWDWNLVKIETDAGLHGIGNGEFAINLHWRFDTRDAINLAKALEKVKSIWIEDLVVHEGPIRENGYLTIQDKPGYGIELNPDVARAHLAPGETWWG